MPIDYAKLQDQYEKMQERKSVPQSPLMQSPASTSTTSNFRPQKKSVFEMVADFTKNTAKSVAGSFVKAGVTGIAAIDATGKALTGDLEGANRVTEEGYNVPGFGQMKPAKIGVDVDEQDERGMFGRETLETIGTGAEIASTLAGGSAGIQGVKTGAKGLVKEAIKQTAKQGAVAGAVSGIGSEIQEEDATIGSTIGAGLEGAAVGGALGAATAAAGSVLTKGGRRGIQASRAASAAKKAEEEALEVVSPKLTNKVKEEALSQGRVSSKGLLKKQVVTPSKADIEIAKSVEGLVSKGAQPVENINAIKTGIKDVAESYVRPVLEANPRPYNMATFKARINELKMPTLFKSNPTLERTYQLVQERAAEIADEFPKTKLGAWQARQKFDQMVEKEFPRVFDGSGQDNVIKHAVNDVRGTWNDFIVEGLPEGNGVREAFKQMSRMYQAVDNISEKGAGDVGTDMLERTVKKYPKAKRAAAAIAGTGALGTAVGYTLGKD